MPYIKPGVREPMEKHIRELTYLIHGVGELNYVITRLCLGYFDGSEQNYRAYNAIIGALHCAAYEFYRRMAAPYEDRKRNENGEVYHVS